MDKHEAMYEYIKKYPDTYNMLGFIFSEGENDKTVFAPVSNESVLKTDILGKKTYAYTFAINVFKSFSTNISEENLENIKAVQDFMAWIDEQEKKKNYPDFENAHVLKIENLQNMPDTAGYNEILRLAKYMFQCRVIYKEI